ncbi:hypothetical protein AURDEDRAFT_131305 [Auricularia subglabra TFB-10046 SS5]|uniref:Uncharacterized protein n=1 Tax=Auricularia subglabra (strain TFB-10046 / SS5) TaxID=717982 RepID=J0CUX0_AURST|nr:hypothetical protein AURDEDRAFT_131305 [Auricularia subglabra TFB-10046 SS5]
MSKGVSSPTDTKPSAPTQGAQNTSEARNSGDTIRTFLAAPEGPTVDELEKFCAMAEVKAGFEQMQLNFKVATEHPSASFAKYKDGWDAICDLLQEVRDLRIRTVELELENNSILDLVQEVADLKCEVARLEEEKTALAQENSQMRENVNTKLSAIDAFIRMERSRARTEALSGAPQAIEGERAGDFGGYCSA